MGKALKTVGTALTIGAVALATAGFGIALGSGVGIAGSIELAGITTLNIGGFGISANALGLAGVAAGSLAGRSKPTRGPTEWVASNDEPLPFPFGRVGMAGKINYRVAYGPNNQYQSIVATLARSGPINSIVSTAFNDIVTTFDGAEKANSGPHDGWMWLQTTLGTQPETALTSPSGLTSGATIPDWGATYKMSGAAAYMLTLSENSKFSEFEGNEEKPLFVLQGLKGWDPRLDGTWPGGSGSCRLLTPSTWVYLSNPAIIALNWAIGRWEGASSGGLYGVPYDCSQVGGIGSSLDGIDVDAFVNAANIADANGWTFAGVPDSAMDESTVLDQMLQAAGALRSRVGGKISCVSRGAEQASLLTVTAADTAGPIELSLGPSRLDRKNTATARFWSETHAWQMTALEPVTNPDWVTQDRGVRSAGVDYPYVPDKDQAAQLAYYDLADNREPISGVIPFKPHMRRIKPGDCFTLSEAGFYLDGIKVKCLRRTTDPMSGIVRVSFRQETDAKHDAAMAQVGVAPPAPGSVTPPTLGLDEPNTISVTPGGSNVYLQARAPLDARMAGGSIKIYARLNNTTFSGSTLIATKSTSSNAFVTHTHTPGSTGNWSYWFVAVGGGAETSDPAGPITVTV